MTIDDFLINFALRVRDQHVQDDKRWELRAWATHALRYGRIGADPSEIGPMCPLQFMIGNSQAGIIGCATRLKLTEADALLIADAADGLFQSDQRRAEVRKMLLAIVGIRE